MAHAFGLQSEGLNAAPPLPLACWSTILHMRFGKLQRGSGYLGCWEAPGGVVGQGAQC